MNVLVVTGGDINAESILKISIPINMEYAKMRGYDFLVKHFSGTPNKFTLNNCSLGFDRMLACFDLLNIYDIVLWVDADALITNNKYRLEDFKTDDKCFHASYDWMGFNLISTGNFMITRSSKVSEFFNQMITVGRNFEGTHGDEQTTINFLASNYYTKSHIEIHDHSIFNSVPICLHDTTAWQDPNRKKIINPWTEESFIAHITGIDNDDRIRIMSSYSTNKNFI